jgi:hypothetical protein
MAVSKSWSSDVPAARHRKLFTVDEANRALPLVRLIVRDIVTTHARAADLHARLAVRLPAPQRQTIEHALEHQVDRLNDLVDELKTVGCELKDYRSGLIDFIGKYAGREIHLCWKLGETCVDHWHELHTGFCDRQPVSKLNV